MSTSWRSSTPTAIPPPPPSDEDPSVCSSASPFSTSLFNFSSGNPRIEETRGLMRLFPDDDSPSPSPSSLPVGRKPLVCVVGVPNHMTYADFCQFCGSFIHHILEMRIVRLVHSYALCVFTNFTSSNNHALPHFLSSVWGLEWMGWRISTVFWCASTTKTLRTASTSTTMAAVSLLSRCFSFLY